MKRKLCVLLCFLLVLSFFSCAANGDVTNSDEITKPLNEDPTDDTTAADNEKQPSKPRFGKLSYKTDGFGIDYIITDADHVNVQKIDGDTVLLIMRYTGDSSFDTYKIGIYDVNGRKYEYLSEELTSEVTLSARSRYETTGEIFITALVTVGEDTVSIPLYYLLSENDGVWTLTKKEGETPDFDTMPEYFSETATSPDGSLFAYCDSVPLEEKKGYYDNRTYIRDSSGEETEILPTEPWIDMYTATAYKPRFFIDNDNLVLGVPYKGYGIYTISTETFSYLPYEDINISPVTYKNGIIYSLAPDARENYTRVFRDSGDGVAVEILPDADTAEYLESSSGLNLYSYSADGEYCGYFYAEGISDGENTTRIYSLDLELIAEISTNEHYQGDEDGEEKNHGFIYCSDCVILIY
ncbi:MAG: hypothetical protein IKT70_00765 [Clostridia bacterium]|nr:hypothetical protein [Clostridia bacterium]